MNIRLFYLFLVIFLTINVSVAVAAQLDVKINPNNDNTVLNIKYQRTVFIEYNDGGEFASILRDAEYTVKFSVDESNSGVMLLMDKLNTKFINDGSVTRVKNLDVEYEVHLVGRELSASVDYKIRLVATISNFIIREYSSNIPALIDAAWRGVTTNDPVVIDTNEFGDVEINLPISFIKNNMHSIYDVIIYTDAEQLLSQNIINAEGIKNQPLTNWHFLFDPTGINVDASTFGLSDEIKGHVISSFTMGESSIREGRQVEKVYEATVVADEKYVIRSIESADSGNISIIGFAAIDKIENNEVFGVSPNSPEGYATTSTGEFPVMIIYGMAGMAGMGAIAILIFSNRKLKKEYGQGQQGIDPSRLMARSTSDSAGGYKTVRGEAYLVDDNNQNNRPSNNTKNKGTMPKGWK